MFRDVQRTYRGLIQRPAFFLAVVLLTAAAGLAAGLAAAAAVTRWISGLLFGVGPLDPLTFVFAPLLLAAVAALALWIPAHRAAHVDPMEAWREE